MTWAGCISYFLITNYTLGPWPLQLMLSSDHRDAWRLMHAISSMLFGGTILVSTMMEWLVVSSKQKPVILFWFDTIPSNLDGAVVLPSLTCAILSGVAQACQDYGSLKQAPKYITGSLHVLLTFALWWVVTDVSTQSASQRDVKAWMNDDDDNDDTVPRVLFKRRWSNVGSCVFVCVLYTLMAFKPGHSSSSMDEDSS